MKKKHETKTINEELRSTSRRYDLEIDGEGVGSLRIDDEEGDGMVFSALYSYRLDWHGPGHGECPYKHSGNLGTKEEALDFIRMHYTARQVEDAYPDEEDVGIVE
jgi:hypothetical protein